MRTIEEIKKDLARAKESLEKTKSAYCSAANLNLSGVTPSVKAGFDSAIAVIKGEYDALKDKVDQLNEEYFRSSDMEVFMKQRDKVWRELQAFIQPKTTATESKPESNEVPIEHVKSTDEKSELEKLVYAQTAKLWHDEVLERWKNGSLYAYRAMVKDLGKEIEAQASILPQTSKSEPFQFYVVKSGSDIIKELMSDVYIKRNAAKQKAEDFLSRAKSAHKPYAELMHWYSRAWALYCRHTDKYNELCDAYNIALKLEGKVA
jgi:hypothetical protein